MGYKLQIHPLMKGTTEEMVTEFVNEAVSVTEVRIIGGMAIVTLYEASESDAQQAIEYLHGNDLNGFSVRVEMDPHSGSGYRGGGGGYRGR